MLKRINIKSPEIQDFFFVMKVAIQVIRGSYHHKVALELFDDQIDIIECLSFDELVDSTSKGFSDYGIMAIENSIAGSIIPNYSLIDDNGLSIIGNNSLGKAFVTGKNLVPNPATGNTAFLIFIV